MGCFAEGPRSYLAKVSARNLFLPAFGATCLILGAIWGRAGSQGGSKNHVFGYHVGKMTKKGVRKRDPKKHQKLIEIGSQNEKVWEAKMSVSLGTCCKIKVFGESCILKKLVPKGVQKATKIGAKNAPRSDF